VVLTVNLTLDKIQKLLVIVIIRPPNDRREVLCLQCTVFVGRWSVRTQSDYELKDFMSVKWWSRMSGAES